MRSYALTRNHVMSRVFLGLGLSLATACAGVYAGQFVPPLLVGLLMLVEIGMIVAGMFLQRSRRIGMPFVLVFTFISGMTLYPAIAYYVYTLGAPTVIKAIAVSAAAFFIAAAVASRSSFDFTFLGGFLFIGLIALLLMGLVSFFIPFSTEAGLIYSVIGIAVFVGYVLFDVNRLVHFGVTEDQVPWVVLSLYLDFVNLFLFILRLFGVLQSDRR
jgi:FtsH-binding integral membrane protein